jgi:hypothetical protein
MLWYEYLILYHNSLPADALFWVWANQFLFLLLSAACLAEKLQITMLQSYEYLILYQAVTQGILSRSPGG